MAGSDHAFGISTEIKYYEFSTDQVQGSVADAPYFDEKGLYLTAATFFKKTPVTDVIFLEMGR
ncbi:MAG: hypothetical protein IPM82_16620 [Saprospiraceae bacterium]|nr:hypothetical protein [Saprospiraceae bacterium]